MSSRDRKIRSLERLAAAGDQEAMTLLERELARGQYSPEQLKRIERLGLVLSALEHEFLVPDHMCFGRETWPPNVVEVIKAMTDLGLDPLKSPQPVLHMVLTSGWFKRYIERAFDVAVAGDMHHVTSHSTGWEMLVVRAGPADRRKWRYQIHFSGAWAFSLDGRMRSSGPGDELHTDPADLGGDVVESIVTTFDDQINRIDEGWAEMFGAEHEAWEVDDYEVGEDDIGITASVDLQLYHVAAAMWAAGFRRLAREVPV